MDICIYHIDGSGSISYFNVCELEFHEGELHIKCIVKDSFGFTFIKNHYWFISCIDKIEVLKVYDYRFV